VLVLTLQLQSLATLLRNNAYVSRFDQSSHSGWIGDTHRVIPYQDLVRQGQIWDYRDIFTALVESDSKLASLPSLFGGYDALELLKINMKFWESDPTDESTKLAILDIIHAILFAAPMPIGHSRQMIEEAQRLVSALVQDDLSLVASRQYIRWMVAKLSSELYNGKKQLIFASESPGTYLMMYHRLLPPLYVPCQSETPNLLKRKPRSELIPMIRTALDEAKSIQDYETAVLCYHALIYGTEDPVAIVQELAYFQQETQGDMQGCLETHLSRYAFCRDQNSRLALRSDILNLRYSKNYPRVLQWARAMVLRSLALSTAEVAQYYSMALRLVVDTDFPAEYRTFFLKTVDQVGHLEYVPWHRASSPTSQYKVVIMAPSYTIPNRPNSDLDSEWEDVEESKGEDKTAARSVFRPGYYRKPRRKSRKAPIYNW
jgi:hypothetical protein